ncbi:MAG TPA: metallophosphoesterase [Thermoguttaceae bacterium]
MLRVNSPWIVRIAVVFLLVLTVCWDFSAQAGEPWKFIVVGDSRGSSKGVNNNGVNAEVLGPLAERIARSGADFLLFSGDLMVGSSWNSTTRKYLNFWRTTMDPVYKAGIKVYTISGNHEWANSNLPEIWREVFPELPDNGPPDEKKMTYSFTHKNAFIIGFDQYFEHRHEVDQKWFDEQLAARDAKAQPHVFAFAHEPAYAAHHTDCMDHNEKARDVFIQSIVDADGRIYFCGHDHFYNHAEIRGFLANNQPVVFHQVIAATAGAPIYHWNGEYGGKNGEGKTVTNIFHDEHWGSYCQVEVNDLTVKVEYYQHKDNGDYSVAESFSYTLPEQK